MGDGERWNLCLGVIRESGVAGESAHCVAVKLDPMNRLGL